MFSVWAVEKYEVGGLTLLTVLALIPPALTWLALCDWLKSRLMGTKRRGRLVRAALIADVVLALCAADAWLVEPRSLSITRISAASSKIAAKTGPIKIVHISDTHFVRRTALTDKVLRAARAERPDLLFVTGDVAQMGGHDARQFRGFLSSLCSIAPTYICTGYDDERALHRASGGRGVILDRKIEVVNVRGTRVRIASRNVILPWLRGEMSDKSLFLVLVHNPDDLPRVAPVGADWCFAGHTHGGQVRLPIWGAITTGAATGKRYEYGRYRIGDMQAFVTRGIGLEPRPAPQVRFLCPPEIMVLTLTRENPGRE